MVYFLNYDDMDLLEIYVISIDLCKYLVTSQNIQNASVREYP